MRQAPAQQALRTATQPAPAILAFAGLALILGVLSCGQVVSRPTSSPQASASAAMSTHTPSPPSPVATATAVPTASASAIGPSNNPTQPFRLAWKLATKPYNKGLALAPSGHLAVLSSRRLALHELRTGKEIASAQVCFTFRDAFDFVEAGVGALVCERAIKVFGLPKLDFRGSKSLPRKARVVAFGVGQLAVGVANGPVLLYSTSDWSLAREISVDQKVTALALSSRGQLAIGLEQGEMLLVDEDQRVRRLSVKRGFEVRSLSFSPDASQLFAAAGPLAAVWRVATLKSARVFRVVREVVTARWVSDKEVGVAGPDGLLLLRVDTGGAHSVGAGWSSGASPPVSADAAVADKVLCSADRDGALACFSRGALPQTQQLPLREEPGGAGSTRMSGRVVGMTGRNVQIKALANNTLPSASQKVLVLRFTERQVGGLRSVSWEQVAEARVMRVHRDIVHVRVSHGTARRLKRDKKRALQYDTPVKLAWKAKGE